MGIDKGQNSEELRDSTERYLLFVQRISYCFRHYTEKYDSNKIFIYLKLNGQRSAFPKLT